MAFALKNIIFHESKNTVHPSAPCSDTFCHYNVEVKKYFDCLTRKRVSNTLWSAFQTRSGVRLKHAFCKIYVTICGRFCTNEGGVAGYCNRIWAKDTANWGVQIAGMVFQTRSSIAIITSIRNFAQRILSESHFVFDCCSQYLRSDPGWIPYLHPAAVTVHVFQN